MKKLFITAVVATLTLGVASAATSVLQDTKNVLKKHADAAKKEVVQTQMDKAASKSNATSNSVKEKVKAAEAKRDAEIKKLENLIKAKKEEIKSVKKTTLSNVEKETRVKVLQKQIETYEQKIAITKSIYQKQIDILTK